MSLIQLKTEASEKEIAWFGVLLLAAAGVAGVMAWRATGALTASRFIWGGGVLVAAVYYLFAPLRRPIFLTWMYAAYPIGWVISHALLALLFFGVVTPIGCVMRVFGYDPMARRPGGAGPSYWIERERRAADPSRYFRQF